MKPHLGFAAFFFCLSASAIDLGILGGASAPQKNRIRYSALIEPVTSVQSQAGAGRTSLYFGSLTFTTPLLKGEKNAFALVGEFQHLNLTSKQDGIGDLYGVQIGGSYTRTLAEGKTLNLTASFGSASDRPFKDTSVDTISATLTYAFTGGPTSRWVLLVNYSNNRPFLNDIPLPGFAYAYFPSKTFMGVFGLPFANIDWRFAESWKLSFFTLTPWVLKTSVSYFVLPFAEVYLGCDFAQVTFLKYGRAKLEDRLYYDEKKLFLGFKSPLSQFLFAEVETGLAFGRQFFQDNSYTLSPVNPVDLGSGWFARVGLTTMF